MQIRPDHYIWKRQRSEYHGGATRFYNKNQQEKNPIPRGPGRSPINCSVCSLLDDTSG